VSVLRAWLLAALAGGILGCGMVAAWRAPDVPRTRDVEAILTEPSAEALARRLQPIGIPDIPVRKRLRPCCEFGYGLRLRVGLLPILGYRIGNLRSVDRLGRHHYDSGFLMIDLDGEKPLVADENNGLVFTCRGGFVDTAHVRDYTDWAIFLAAHLYAELDRGTVIDLPDEGGRRRVVLPPVDERLLRKHDRVSLAVGIAQGLAFQLSVWHEIATWYGWSTMPGFSEQASAFSPEDLYSNLIGTKIAAATAYERSARSAALYERSVDAWLREILRYLGPLPISTAVEAMKSLDGTWWSSRARIPDGDAVMRRNLALGSTLTPWIVPADLASDALKRDLLRMCGGWPTPLTLPNPSRVADRPLDSLATLEIRPDRDLLAHPVFARLGRRITQEAFPALVEEIGTEVRARFGPRADRPD